MPISMSLLRSETLEHLGIDATDLDTTGTTSLDLLINRSWWEVSDEFDFKEKETLSTFSTVAGTRSYAIVTVLSEVADEAIQNVSYLDPNTSKHISVPRTTFNWYEANYNEQTTLRGAPQKWFHYSGNLYLYPTPDQVYTITCYHKTVLPDLSGSVNPAIPQPWHEAILYGAVKRGFLRARDYNSANMIEQQQLTAFRKLQTTESKEDSEDHDAGVRVIRPTYSVRHT